MTSLEHVVRQQAIQFNGDVDGFLANCTPNMRVLRNGTLVAESPEGVKHVLRHEQGRRWVRPATIEGEVVAVEWDKQHDHKPTGYMQFECQGDRVSAVNIQDDPLILERLLGIY